MTPRLIVLRGAPGTGKSSVAQRLVDRLEGGVVVEVDHIRRMIPNVDWQDDKLHFDAISIAAARAKSFVACELRAVVLVDTLGYGRLEFALAALGTLPAKVHSLVCREPVLSLRLLRRTRGYRDVHNARKFNAHIQRDALRYPIIDTTWRNAASVAVQIIG